MMNRRRTEGDETWVRLLDWTRGQKASERLAAHILRVEGFSSVDPSHPLGGRDGLKDVICMYGKAKWIGAAYFPRGQQAFKDIVDKFDHDLAGVEANSVAGLAFVTNQELKLSERTHLEKTAEGKEAKAEIFHLERIASILDSPQCYGIRLEFLDIEMTKEEQLGFIAARDTPIEQLQMTLEAILIRLPETMSLEQIQASIPLSEIQEFKAILDSIAGYEGYNPFLISTGLTGLWQKKGAHINDLRVPLQELEEFKNLLHRIVGEPELDLWSAITMRTSGILGILGKPRKPTVKDLQVPLAQLEEYEATLDRIIEKLREKKRLES